MSGIIRTLSKSEEAFTAVMSVGRDFAQRIEEAQIAGDTVAEALAMNFGMTEMQDAIAKHKEAADVIARAAGHKWGFKTDQDNEGKGSTYSREVLIACFCEAALLKLKGVGNEFNVIQSGVYVTREGWCGKLDRLPGVTEIEIVPGAIREYDEKEYTTKIRTTREGKQYGGEQKTKLVAYVSATASCKVWGQPVEVRAWLYPDGRDERYQLTGTADIVEAMIDQLKGKAAARIAEQLYYKCVGLSRRGPVRGETVSAEQNLIEVQPVTREVVAQRTIERVKAFDPSTVDVPQVTHDPGPETIGPRPFTEQIESATKTRELDSIARAIVAAKLSEDETEFLKAMVLEARKRLG